MSIIPIIFGSKGKANKEPVPQDAWDPFEVSSIRSHLVTLSSNTLTNGNVLVDWKETPTAHVFKADLPGLSKDKMKVEVEEQRFLRITGERSKEVEEKDDKWHRVSRSYGKFLGRIQLPENATVRGAKAVLESGVLTVTVPKDKDQKLQARVIEIEG